MSKKYNEDDDIVGVLDKHELLGIKSRHYCNIIILKRLTEFVNSNPDLRFGQILRALDIIDDRKSIIEGVEVTDLSYLFYEEPEETLRRIESALDNL